MPGLLQHATYDPSIAVTNKATSSLLAMTAVDTTNLRCTFNAPASGNVLVRLKCQLSGATTFPRIQLGVLETATLRGRQTPVGKPQTAIATVLASQEASYVITGLTPAQQYVWDAAYGVDILLAATNIKYGGPNDASGADAFGAFNFEVWDANNLLAGTLYDPLTADATKVATSLLAMTALDTTNLRLTFTAPASGKVLWRLRVPQHGSTTIGQVLLGILESTTVVARTCPVASNPSSNTLLATDCVVQEASGVVTGVSAGSHTWDAAYAVQVVAGAGGLKWGGPNDTTTNNSFGGAAFELWAA